MARGKGKGKGSQGSLRMAGLLPTLKKPREAIGLNANGTRTFFDEIYLEWSQLPSHEIYQHTISSPYSPRP